MCLPGGLCLSLHTQNSLASACIAFRVCSGIPPNPEEPPALDNRAGPLCMQGRLDPLTSGTSHRDPGLIGPFSQPLVALAFLLWSGVVKGGVQR